MGEKISEELEELEATARDEAIKQILKAWEERPQEKVGSWGPIFGHGKISINFGAYNVTVGLAEESRMRVTAHATGNGFSEIVQLSPGDRKTFRSTISGISIANVKITGLGSEDQHAFGFCY